MLATQFQSYSVDNYKVSNLDILNDRTSAFHQLSEWLDQTGLVTGITYAFSKESADQVSLKFRLAEKYENNFVWLRGFISLGNHFKIIADRDQRTFSLTLNSGDLLGFKTYLEKVFDVLRNELMFRAELKLLIKLEARFIKLQNAIRSNSKAFFLNI